MEQTTTNGSKATTSTRDPESVVRAMFEAVRVGDHAAFAACWAENAVWDNIPVKAVRGHAEICAKWKPLLDKPGSFVVEYKNVAVNGNVVFTERVDYINMKRVKVVAPVNGVFEIQDGKIVNNREYWDLITGTLDMVRATFFKR